MFFIGITYFLIWITRLAQLNHRNSFYFNIRKIYVSGDIPRRHHMLLHNIFFLKRCMFRLPWRRLTRLCFFLTICCCWDTSPIAGIGDSDGNECGYYNVCVILLTRWLLDEVIFDEVLMVDNVLILRKKNNLSYWTTINIQQYRTI
jgi:hypothetical protein